MKRLILKFFPDAWLRFIYNKTLRSFTINSSYNYDRKRFKKYSDSFLMKNKYELLGNITKHYHVFEKGLTMPETRLGFGQPKMLMLIKECERFIERFGKNEPQLAHAIAVIKEYDLFHQQKNHKLYQNTTEAMDKLLSAFTDEKPSSQLLADGKTYFKHSKSSFDLFARSRHSVRNYSKEKIPLDKIEEAIKLAAKTPSACNRQSWRTHIFSDKARIKKILEVQGGNRGFGHLSDKLIVITGELGVFGHSFERNQVFVDGGMYAMSLLYALHFHEIASCPLNCSTTPSKDKKLQELCGFPPSQVLIVMISCGVPPENFKLATSPRYEIQYTNSFIGH